MTQHPIRSAIAALLPLTVILTATVAWAVKPGTWTHHTEADFAAAKQEGSVVTSLGEVQLARAASAAAEMEGDDSVIYDIARTKGGRVFLAAGPGGKLVELAGEKPKVKVVAEYSGEQVFALVERGAGLWVAVSGKRSRLEYRDGEEMKVSRTIELPEVRYVWDMLLEGKRMWVATGGPGRVLQLDLEAEKPEPRVALESGQDNVLCLGIDGHSRVYGGTDGDGLVYRITPGGGGFDTFVLFDAPEPEIGALLVNENGVVYAGTADARQARPGRLEAAAAERKGRPEKPGAEEREPTIPNVPPKPQPQPGGQAGKAPRPAPPPATSVDPAKADPPAATPPPAIPAPPTPQQYQQLRQAIQQRLEQARQAGAIKLQASPRTTATTVSRSRPTLSPSRSGGSTSGRRGNAVYRISSDGFVREIFRESVMILRLGRAGEALLVATGNEGQLYHVDPDAEEVTILADLEPKQVPALLNVGHDRFLLGTANPAQVVRLAPTYAAEAIVTSEALDAGQISLWGKLQIMAHAPDGTALEVQTRSGNVADPDAAEGSWSKWSKPHQVGLVGGHSDYIDVLSPNARFLQYRLRLRSEGESTPSVLSISLKYLMPNLKPKIQSIQTEYAKAKSRSDDQGPAPLNVLKVEWKASDPNKDRLRYRLEVKPYGTDDPFVTIKDDLSEDSFSWNTLTTPDGRYLLRVAASDEGDNIPQQALTSSRRSDPVIIDNTPPEIRDLIARQTGPGSAEFSAHLADDLTAVSEIRYSIDSDKQWKFVLPRDLIYDSTSESVQVKIDGLSTGAHVLTVRATDSQGNTRYVSRRLDIKP